MTMHRANGLEFPHVFLPAWEDGGFPSVRAGDEGSGDEERRLAYVAITRAMRRLTISYAAFRVGRGYTGLSTFIDDIPSENVKRRYGNRLPRAWDASIDMGYDRAPRRVRPRPRTIPDTFTSEESRPSRRSPVLRTQGATHK